MRPRKALVTKAGDGGALPAAVVHRLNDPIAAVERGPVDSRRANLRVVMTPLCPKSRRVATEDPVDRAHSTRYSKGQLVRGDHVAGAKPREYDPSYIVTSETGKRCTIETAADWLHNARRRLSGIPGVGLGGDGECEDDGRGMMDDRSSVMRERTRAILERGRGGFRVTRRP
jgi:hypothetical protein